MPSTETTHRHGAGCGHTAIRHDGHIDYLKDGHLDHVEARGESRHVIGVTARNPDKCRPTHAGHGEQHRHGPGCGHEPVPHGDHIDYLVDGHLHHPHGDHCDDHGAVEVVEASALPSAV